MDNISFVVNLDGDKIKECINLFSPIIESRESEIIVINNEINNIDIPYRYTIYGFSDEYSNFKRYCLELSENRKIIIVEKGLKITAEVVDEINNKIDSMDYCNLKFKIKRYIGNDKSFIDEDVILYNRGIKGFNEYAGTIIEDHSLVEFNEEDIDRIIEKLLRGGFYKELYIWFENEILNKDDNYKLKFFEILEKKKTFMDYDKVKIIENIFLDGKPNKYREYLNIKILLDDTENINKNVIITKIKQLNFNERDVYFSWLLKDLLAYRDYFIDCLSNLDGNSIKRMLQYLFNNDKNFNYEIYNFIVKCKENGTEAKEIILETYLDIIRLYMKFIQNRIVTHLEKQRLIEVFSVYMEVSVLLLNKGHYKFKEEGEENFIAEIQKSQLSLKNNQIEKTITLVKDAAKNFKTFEETVDIYIQSLRSKYKCYPYKLSICMIVRDEEKNLERCLIGLKPLINLKIAELIIVDTGSRDKTVEIANKYNADIYYYMWNRNFSKARNYSISKASGEYIFIIDADEEIRESEIKKLIGEFDGEEYKHHNTFTLKLKNYTNMELTQFAIFTQPLIFKNDGTFYYSGTVHNQPIYKGPVKHLEIEIIHYGYIMTEDIRDKKFKRTAGLLKKELEKDPKNIYYRFQLATSYSMYGDYKEALKHVKIYMRRIKEEKLTGNGCLMLYNNAAYIYINNNLLDEAMEICDEGLKINSDFIDFIYYKALILFNREKYYEVLPLLNRYIELRDNFYNLDIVNNDSYSFYTLAYKDDVVRMAILTNHLLGNYTESIKCIDLMENRKVLNGCIYAIVDSCFKVEDLWELAKFYKNYVQNSDDMDIRGSFKYFVVDNILKCDEKKIEAIINEFQGIVDEFTENLKIRIQNKKGNEVPDTLYLIKTYDIDSLSFIKSREIFDKILPLFDDLKLDMEQSPEVLFTFKRFAQFIMHRGSKLSFSRKYSPDKLVVIFNKYMNICSRLMGMGRRDLLESRERYFLAFILSSFREIEKKNYKAAINIINTAVRTYRDMDYIMELVVKTLIPDCDGRECQDNIDDNEYEKEAYSEKIKKELIENGNGDMEEIIHIFNVYNNSNLYDENITSLYSAVLMEQNRLEKAEKILINGLKSYNNSSHLATNLSRVYSLKKESERAIEYFVKSRMLEPEGKLIGANEVMLSSSFCKLKKLKVLHGTLQFSGKIGEITKFLNRKGIYAKSLNYYPKGGECSEDYVMDLNSLGDGNKILNGINYAASKLIPEFDIFHFHFGTTLIFNNRDLEILRELNKKVFTQFWGYDVRMYSKAIRLNPYLRGENLDEEKIKNKLDKMSKYIEDCIVGDYEIYEYVRDYFKRIHVINPMIDIKKYKLCDYENNNDKLLIVHAPVSRTLKGTGYILRAIDNLKTKYSFDFKLVEGLSHDEAVEIYRRADLIIDQLITGTYGMLSLEAMALGKPVICYISDFMKDKYPKELPIISANLDNIEERLEYILQNRDILRHTGREGRNFVEKYHDINNEIDKIVDLYKKS